MNAARFVVGDGVAVVTVDPDPNVTAPGGDRIFVLPNRGGTGTAVYLAAEGGTPTVELWVQAMSPGGRWFRMGDAVFVVPVDSVRSLSSFTIPLDMPAFLRVTIVGGCTRVGGGLAV